MSNGTRQRKTFGYWSSLLIGVLLACVLMNAITFSYQRDLFRSWTQLGGPPSGIKQIMAAGSSQVWVETQDSSFFTANPTFYCRDADICWEWEAVTDISEIPQQGFSFMQVDTCKNLWNPAAHTYLIGTVAKCVYARDTSRILGDEGYFALTSGGDIFYWRNIRNPIATPVLFIFSSFIVPSLAAVVISAVYLIIQIFARLRKTSYTQAYYL